MPPALSQLRDDSDWLGYGLRGVRQGAGGLTGSNRNGEPGCLGAGARLLKGVRKAGNKDQLRLPPTPADLADSEVRQLCLGPEHLPTVPNTLMR